MEFDAEDLKKGDIVAVDASWLDLTGNDIGIVKSVGRDWVVIDLLLRKGEYNGSGYFFTKGKDLRKLAHIEEE
jgi:hypothetical protein